MVNSSEKGAEYERQVCQRLSLWVSKMTRQDVFWRSASSGGRATVRLKQLCQQDISAHAGDIVLTHELGAPLLKLFMVECKFYADLQFEQLIFGRLGQRKIIWDKPLAEARASKREPFCVLKQNRKVEILLTTKRGVSILKRGGDVTPHVHFAEMGAYALFFRDVLVEVSHAKMIKKRKRKKL